MQVHDFDINLSSLNITPQRTRRTGPNISLYPHRQNHAPVIAQVKMREAVIDRNRRAERHCVSTLESVVLQKHELARQLPRKAFV